MLYLAYTDAPDPPDLADLDGPWRGVQQLRPGLWLLDSGQPRSPVYHAVKDMLPTSAALLVTQCHEIPKFKGMDAGSLAWARRHIT